MNAGVEVIDGAGMNDRMSDLFDVHIGVHEKTAVQFLNGEFCRPDIHFDKAKAKRVACKVVPDDL